MVVLLLEVRKKAYRERETDQEGATINVDRPVKDE